MNSYGVLFSIGLVLALVDFGACLQCYHCDSVKDPNCGLIFKNSTSARTNKCGETESTEYIQKNLFNILPSNTFGGTTDDPYYCHKIELASGTVVRSCVMTTKGAPIDALCKKLIEDTKSEVAGKKVAKCNACDKDGCNSAGSLSVSLPLVILATVAYLFKQ